MEKIIKIESNLPSHFLRIELFLSNVCNYKCNYCFTGNNEGTHPWPKLETFLNNLDHLITYYKNNAGKEQIYIHIIGGEPTLWRDFGTFVQYLKNKHNCLISISTNGSRTLRWWEEYGHYIDRVLISCHPEYVDTRHIIQIADMLYRKHVPVVALVLMDTKYWNRCIQIIDELSTSAEPWDIALSQVYHSSVLYTKKQKDFLLFSKGRPKNLNRTSKELFRIICRLIKRKKTIPYPNPTIYTDDGKKETVPPHWLALNKKYFFEGWKCNLGVDTLFIEKNGCLQGACGQALYDLNFKYNIFDENFKEVFSPKIIPTTCRKNSPCVCQPETNATKELVQQNQTV